MFRNPPTVNAHPSPPRAASMVPMMENQASPSSSSQIRRSRHSSPSSMRPNATHSRTGVDRTTRKLSFVGQAGEGAGANGADTERGGFTFSPSLSPAMLGADERLDVSMDLGSIATSLARMTEGDSRGIARTLARVAVQRSSRRQRRKRTRIAVSVSTDEYWDAVNLTPVLYRRGQDLPDELLLKIFSQRES